MIFDCTNRDPNCEHCYSESLVLNEWSQLSVNGQGYRDGEPLSDFTFPFLLQVGASRVSSGCLCTDFQCLLRPCLKENDV